MEIDHQTETQSKSNHRLDQLIEELEQTMTQPNQEQQQQQQQQQKQPQSILFPSYLKPTPPPLPPKLPNPIRRKISLPSLNSSSSSVFGNLASSSSSSPLRQPPPVPRLPENYQPPKRNLNHQELNLLQQPSTHNSIIQSSSASASASSSSSSSILPSALSPSSSSANSPRNLFKRPNIHAYRANSNAPPYLNPATSASSTATTTPPRRNQHHLLPLPLAIPAQDSSSIPPSSLSPHPLPSPVLPARPLPHLPQSYPQSAAATAASSSSSNLVSMPIPSLPELSHEPQSSYNSSSSASPSSHRTSRFSTGFSGGVPYTNILHDYDLPLGAHSIPTRIGTRPINFTSSDYDSTKQSSSTDQDHQSSSQIEPAPVLPPVLTLEPSDLKPINFDDRELILNGPGLLSDHQFPSGLHHRDKTNEDRNDGDGDGDKSTIPLQIYTTRPSMDSHENLKARHRRSTSVKASKPTHQSLTNSLSSSLSAERRSNRNNSIPNELSAINKAVRSELAGSKASQITIQPGFNLACLSHIAQFLKSNVPRDTKIKANVDYPMTFTGRDAVTTITHCLNRINPSTRSTTQATLNRKLALSLCRALLAERFFHEATSLDPEVCLNDNVDELFKFPTQVHRNNKTSGWVNSRSSFEDYALGTHGYQGNSAHLPQGVLTNLTKCYSFSCQMNDLNSNPTGSVCYSYDCPSRKNRRTVSYPSATNQALPSSLPEISIQSSGVVQTKDWASVVPKELLTSIDSKEIARQSIIYELISGEQEYVQDLDDYEKLFIIPLMNANPPILPPQRLTDLREKVISNVLEVRDHNRVLLQNLLIRQQDQHPLVKGIGDVILNAALEWGPDYIRYTSDHVFGEVEVNKEKDRNPMFADLINKIPKLSPRRADFKHYYSRAFVRLQRYVLLLESLLKKTPEGYDDRASIESAMDVLRRQCKDADQAVSLQQAKLQLINLNNEIVVKPDTPDLQLLSPNRQLVFSGKMLRKPEGGTGLSEWTELHVMLFDHYFLVTKVKRIDEHTVRYHLSRPPIMLEMMRVTGFNEPCERKSRGLRTITGTLGSNGGLERGNSDPYSSPSSQGPSSGVSGLGPSDDRWLYPITIQSLGRNAYSITLYVDSERARIMWKAKFEETIGLRMQILDSFKVFDLYPMTDQTFAASGSVMSHSSGSHVNGSGTGGSSGSAGASGQNGPTNRPQTVGEAISNLHGPPTCSVPFRSSDGKRLVAIGCNDGLWIGLRNDPSSMRQVIYLKSITQCAVLQEFGFLLVLAEKILMAYPLESLIPSRAGAAIQPQQSSTTMIGKSPTRAIASRLSGNKDVLFFRCGKVGPRTLVIYVKKGGVNQTVFKALEPVKTLEKTKASSSRGFFGIGGTRSDSFRGYKEFFVPSESYAIQYLRNTLTIHCARGFEIMNLDTLKTASIPDFNQIKQQDARLAALQRRCDESRPLGMFRLGDNEFLLCYDEFAFFADKHGDPLVDRYNSIMEWDGRPNSVAYSAPYVICFSSTMIEVWNTLTSKRVQIIIGQTIQCTYDGGALGDDGSSIRSLRIDHQAANHAPSSDEDEGERRVHVMMKDHDQFYRVFELVPLNLR